MSISEGHLKYKRHIKQDDDTYKLVSHWTSADTVEFKNGITLEDSKVELTQAEYDALGEEKLSNDVEYFITDSSVSDAVQEAIDEVNEKIETINTDVAENTTAIAENTSAITQLNSDFNKHYKAGWFTVSGLTSTTKTVSIDFSEPLATTNYSISVMPYYAPYFAGLQYAVKEKRLSGFDLQIANSSASATETTYNFDWSVQLFN